MIFLTNVAQSRLLFTFAMELCKLLLWPRLCMIFRIISCSFIRIKFADLFIGIESGKTGIHQVVPFNMDTNYLFGIFFPKCPVNPRLKLGRPLPTYLLLFIFLCLFFPYRTSFRFHLISSLKYRVCNSL